MKQVYPLKRSYPITEPAGKLGKGKKAPNGFTLIELITAMAVLTFAVVAVFYAFTMSIRIFSTEMYDSDISVEMHRAMDRMSKEFRNSLELVSSSGTSISFWYRDLNGNGTREANETITYSWTGGTVEALTRTIGSSTIRLANNIVGFSLIYDNPSAIKEMKIIITGKKGTSLGTIESSVKSRNL